MKQTEILKTLNNKYKDRIIFEVTDNESEIVGFLDDGSFQNIVAVIEPTESEMNNLIKHIDKNLK